MRNRIAYLLRELAEMIGGRNLIAVNDLVGPEPPGVSPYIQIQWTKRPPVSEMTESDNGKAWREDGSWVVYVHRDRDFRFFYDIVVV